MHVKLLRVIMVLQNYLAICGGFKLHILRFYVTIVEKLYFDVLERRNLKQQKIKEERTDR